ncbi:MAG: hypothetical protein GX276_03090 [Clostridiaceae bacterium]|jgi:hypothetical protein|nr:hypothetical protein [Clostridiaceae bacterium]
MTEATVIEKVLSANDTGETGGHQAGILVPKEPRILGFFPSLNVHTKNPRAVLDMLDDTGHEWTFHFIYYNNRFFGGTRNEYRITGMTAFFREFNLRTGDAVIFRRISAKHLNISYRRAAAMQNRKIIHLSSTWKVIKANV